MQAIELVRDRVTKKPAEAETREVLVACHRRGLLLTSAGTFGNVIRLLVPLVATDHQIEEGLEVLEQRSPKCKYEPLVRRPPSTAAESTSARPWIRDRQAQCIGVD
jgi:hypothetical protein